MARHTGIGGRFGVGIAFALSLILSPILSQVAIADDKKSDDDVVGWPLKRTHSADGEKSRTENNESIEREILGDAQSAPAPTLPQRSEVTDQALAAWSTSAIPTSEVEAADLPADRSSDSDAGNRSATAPAKALSPEIAPLKRIIPPVRHELILYSPGDFSISVATAERLNQMAMRLRGTRDRISIIAHSGSLVGDAQISTHEAVKLSFKRAMLVRLYLIEEGVSPDQIDLEALPQADDGGPEDRVEISATSRAARR